MLTRILAPQLFIALMRPYSLIFLLWLLTTAKCLAMPEPPPPHSLSPVLNGLNIATYIKKDRVKIMLYVINHEAFPVLCDAQFSSGQDKQEATEINIPADKADVFRFTYGRLGDSILLNLICIDPSKNLPPETPSNDDTQ